LPLIGFWPDCGGVDLVIGESASDDALDGGGLTADGNQCSEGQVDGFAIAG